MNQFCGRRGKNVKVIKGWGWGMWPGAMVDSKRPRQLTSRCGCGIPVAPLGKELALDLLERQWWAEGEAPRIRDACQWQIDQRRTWPFGHRLMLLAFPWLFWWPLRDWSCRKLVITSLLVSAVVILLSQNFHGMEMPEWGVVAVTQWIWDILKAK